MFKVSLWPGTGYIAFPRHFVLGYHHQCPLQLCTPRLTPITQFLRLRYAHLLLLPPSPPSRHFVLPTLASCLPNTSPTHGFIILFPTFFTQKRGRSSENHASQEMGERDGGQLLTPLPAPSTHSFHKSTLGHLVLLPSFTHTHPATEQSVAFSFSGV